MILILVFVYFTDLKQIVRNHYLVLRDLENE